MSSSEARGCHRVSARPAECTCDACGAQCRHKGERERRLDSSLGTMTLRGIYWACPRCPSRRHSVDVAGDEPLTHAMKNLVMLAGVAAGSFDKSALIMERMLGVKIDDDAIRHLCLSEGQKKAGAGAPELEQVGDEVVGSCDGTMVNTRENQWREVKALRFEHTVVKHEEGREERVSVVYGAAYLEKAPTFTPRLAQTAERLGADDAKRRVFVADCAEWISLAVKRKLPGFVHVADYWHACQHVHKAAEALYGKEHPDARKWSRSIDKRLRENGAAKLSARLKRVQKAIPQYWRVEAHEGLRELCRYLDKHASKMDYPTFEAAGLPISSGPMESFCKQLGQRMKGPGMRWCERNVTAMAMLVSSYVTDPKRFATRNGAA